MPQKQTAFNAHLTETSEASIVSHSSDSVSTVKTFKMSTLISVVLLFTHLVTFVNANLIDDATRLESELNGSKIKRNAKNLVNDVTTLEFLDELKNEVLNSNDHDQLKTKLHDILRKKESEILSKAKSDVKKEVAKKVIEPVKEISVSTSEDFFKAAGSRDDDFAKDPEAKRAIEMMIDDLLTKEIKALPDGIQKRGEKCEDKIKHCKFLADKGRCHNNKRIVEYCPKSCLMCKAATPPKCSKSTFGCCWDKVCIYSVISSRTVFRRRRTHSMILIEPSHRNKRS